MNCGWVPVGVTDVDIQHGEHHEGRSGPAHGANHQPSQELRAHGPSRCLAFHVLAYQAPPAPVTVSGVPLHANHIRHTLRHCLHTCMLACHDISQPTSSDPSRFRFLRSQLLAGLQLSKCWLKFGDAKLGCCPGSPSYL